MTRHLVIALVVVIVGGLIGNWFRFASASSDSPADFSAIPLQFDRYQGREDFFSEQTYRVLSATSTTLKRYVDESGTEYDLFVAYFDSHRFGAGIHSPLHCLPGGGWRIEQQEPFVLDLADGAATPVNRMLIAFGGRTEVMLYWYVTRLGSARTEMDLKLSITKSALLLKPTDAAIVRLTVPVVGGDVESATGRATRFLQTAAPHIKEALPF